MSNVLIEGVGAEIVDGATGAKITMTDSSGSYLLAELNVCEVLATFRKSGYEVFETSVTLSAVQTLDVTLRECSATLSPTNQTVSVAVVVASVDLTTLASCEWMETCSNALFITSTSRFQ